MEKLQRKKSVKKAVYFAIYNKYRFEHYGFCLALIGIFYIEYLQPVITQYFASNKSEIWS